MGFVRLACLIHAANVRSEPGSNPSKLAACAGPLRNRRIIPCFVASGDDRGENLKHKESDLRKGHLLAMTQRFRVMSSRPPPRDCVMPEGTTQPRLALHFWCNPSCQRSIPAGSKGCRSRSEENSLEAPRDIQAVFRRSRPAALGNRPG